MIHPIVDSADFVTILGPCEVKSEDIEESLRFATILVAADGGAKHALDLGHVPDAVIGDFDSFPPGLSNFLPDSQKHRIDEQDSTDFEKCLTRIRSPLCLAIGFTGKRRDHELAVYSTLVRHGDRACILISEDDVMFAAPQRAISLDLAAGTRVSLFPFAKLRAKATGLHWPIDALQLDPLSQIGTSNHSTGPMVLEAADPGLLVILPRSELHHAIAALTAEL